MDVRAWGMGYGSLGDGIWELGGWDMRAWGLASGSLEDRMWEPEEWDTGMGLGSLEGGI